MLRAVNTPREGCSTASARTRSAQVVAARAANLCGAPQQTREARQAKLTRAPRHARRARRRETYQKRRRAVGESAPEEQALRTTGTGARVSTRDARGERVHIENLTHTLSTHKESRLFLSPSSSSLDDSDPARTLSAPTRPTLALASPTRALLSLARSYSRTRARASTLFPHLHGLARRRRRRARRTRTLRAFSSSRAPSLTLAIARRRRFRNFYSDSD